MTARTIRKWLGLVTAPNQHGVPPGSLSVATNVSLEREGVIRPRPGLDDDATYATYLKTHRLWEYSGTLMLHLQDGGTTWRLGYRPSAGTVTVLSGDIKNPDPSGDELYRLNTAQVGDTLYIAESLGVRRCTSASTAVTEFAGAPKCPDLDRGNSTLTSNASGVLPTQKSRAYRATFHVKDAFDRELVGSPSGRMTLRNETSGGGASNQIPLVRVLIPKAVNTASTALTTSYWVRLYASSMTETLAQEPLEDFGLIYEAQLSSTNITNGYVDITDVTPDDLRGSALYTNPTQEGILQANEPPPFARHVASWKDCLVLGNLAGRERLEIQVLAVGGSGGIADADTFNVVSGATTLTLTAKTTPAASGDYGLVTTLTSVSANIEATVQNLCAAINRHASNTFCYAFYTGSPEDPRSVGRFVIESRLANDANEIYAYVGTGDNRTCFEPTLPETAAGNVVSVSDDWANGWALSKRSEPDAFPLLQAGRLGQGNLVRVIALDEVCFFFLDSGDVWTMSGEPPYAGDPGTLRVEPWRHELQLIAPFSAAVLDGKIYCWTDKGVAAINASGYEIVSGAIAEELRQSYATNGPATTWRKVWGAADPARRKYLLGIYASSAYAGFYTYHLPTQAWTKTDRSLLSCATFSRTEGKLFFGAIEASSGILRSEKAGIVTTDFDDEGASYTVTVTPTPVLSDTPVRPKQLREVQLDFETAPTSGTTFDVTVTTEHGTATVSAAGFQGTHLLRVVVPQSVQRGASHTVSVSSTVNRKIWALSGMTLLFREYAPRATE